MNDIGLLIVDISLWLICFIVFLVKDGIDDLLGKMVGAFVFAGIVFVPAMIVLSVISSIFK